MVSRLRVALLGMVAGSLQLMACGSEDAAWLEPGSPEITEGVQTATPEMYPSPKRGEEMVLFKTIGKANDLVVTITDRIWTNPILRIGMRNEDGSVTQKITSAIPTGAPGYVLNAVSFNSRGDLIVLFGSGGYLYYLPATIDLSSNTVVWKSSRLFSGIKAAAFGLGITINFWNEVVVVWTNETGTAQYYSTAYYDSSSGLLYTYKHEVPTGAPIIGKTLELSNGGPGSVIMLLLNRTDNSMGVLASGRLNYTTDYSVSWNFLNQIADGNMTDADIDETSNISIAYGWNFTNGSCKGFQVDHRTGYYTESTAVISLRNDRRRVSYVQGCWPNENSCMDNNVRVARFAPDKVMITYPSSRHTLTTDYTGGQLLSIVNDVSANTFVVKGEYTLTKYNGITPMRVNLDY